jgi:hypothetical protein
MVTFIIGDEGTGKTRLSRQIVGDKKYVSLPPSECNSRFIPIDETTEYIIYEDLREPSDITPIIFSDIMKVERQMKSPIEIKTPNIIVVCSPFLNLEDILKIKNYPYDFYIIETSKTEGKQND